jgi:hypothetical protein
VGALEEAHFSLGTMRWRILVYLLKHKTKASAARGKSRKKLSCFFFEYKFS